MTHKHLFTAAALACIAASQTACVKEPPVPDFDIVNNGCIAPCNVEFENQTTGPASFEWNFGNGNFSNERNTSHTYNTPGNYTVSLAANNKKGSNTISHVVNILPAYGAPVADFSYTVHQAAPDTYTLDFLNESTGEETNYTWKITSNGNATTHVIGGTDLVNMIYPDGILTVQLIASNLAGADTATQTITLRPDDFNYFSITSIEITALSANLSTFDAWALPTDIERYADPFIAVYRPNGTAVLYDNSNRINNQTAAPFTLYSTAWVTGFIPAEILTIALEDYDGTNQPERIASFSFQASVEDENAVWQNNEWRQVKTITSGNISAVMHIVYHTQ